MPKIKYKDPADGQFKVVEVDNPDQSHGALAGMGAADAHTQYWTPAGSDQHWYKTDGGGFSWTGEKANNKFTGQLTVEGADPYIYIHNPGHTHIRLEAGSAAGYALKVVDPSDRTPRPVLVGNDLTREDTLFTWTAAVDSLTNRVSGPHGPHGHWHAGGPDVWYAYPSGALYYPIINIPGMWKIQITADMWIDQPLDYANLPEIYLGIEAKWSAGNQGYNNGQVTQFGRLASRMWQRGHLRTATAVAHVPNVIGDQLKACGTALAKGSSNVKYIGGDYKHTFEFWPYGSNWSFHQYGWIHT